MQPLRILIVDDHEVIRRGLRSLLSSRSEWQVCGEAVNGVEGVQKASELRPDLVLMDMSMPEMGGVEATKIIRQELPKTKVIIVSQNDPEVTRRQTQNLGTAGFVAKANLSRDLLKTIDQAFETNTTTGKSLEPNGKVCPSESEAGPPWLAGGGEMGALMRSKNWSRNSLGPLQKWPQSLKTSVGICISSRFDLIVWWGPDLIMLYNDSYRRTLGAKHPNALGTPGRVVYPEIWDVIGPMLDRVLETGEATWSEDLLLLLERNGYPEETYHTFSYTPIRDEYGNVMGVITPVAETTDKVISERRLMTLRDLAAQSIDAKSEPEAWEFAARALSGNPYDLPFAVLYRLDEQCRVATSAATAGIKSDNRFFPQNVELSGDFAIAPYLEEVVLRGQPIEFDQLDKLDFSLPGGFWGVSPVELVFLPIAQAGQDRAMGVLAVGINRHKRLDDGYRGFLNLVAGQIAKSVADVRILDEERKRAEALAELDRAKTAFFSNISHELRTPLTLILSPLEDMLSRANPEIVTSSNEIELVHRNATRLLKLVNALLDFSRLEAGRIQASFEPTNLGQITNEIASVFRSAIERAGLEYEIQISDLDQRVFVDPQMWEKIILNLISNALKFTPQGKIIVDLRQRADAAELAVTDTGIGISEQEIPRIFERFHRVEGTSARTHEGTGIGLALVQELARIHGGTIHAESELGKGSRFVVSIPIGSKHLPQERVRHESAEYSATGISKMFTNEALAWTPGQESEIASAAPTGQIQDRFGRRPRILLAEDNADMRAYVWRLLTEQGFLVESVHDGIAALEKVRSQEYDLILSDVMMPRLDGIGLLRAIREDDLKNKLPVILLSARAGEEFRIQGLGSGADDYLVKPFSARELVSRVRAHIDATLRRSESEERLNLTLELGRMGTWDTNLLSGEMFWSPGLFRLFGYQPGECKPSHESWEKRVYPGDIKHVIQSWETAKESRRDYGIEYRIVWPDGSTHWIEARGRFFRSENGQPYRDLGAALDVTSRKASEESLRKGREELAEKVKDHEVVLQQTISEATTQAELLDLANDAAFVSDLQNRISYWSRGAERLYGWSQKEVIGKNASELLQTEFPVPFAEVVEALERDGRWEGDLLQTTRYGLRMSVASRWTYRRDAEGNATGWLEINSDITQQKRAEEAARRLSGRILQLQDEERRKLARELHDSLGQYLAALKINTDACLRAANDAKFKNLLEDSVEMIEQCLTESRTMSYLLHPPLLDETGLSSAVKWLVEGFGQRSGIQVSLTAPAAMPRFSREIETALFRILQESLANAHRHAATDRVEVEIKVNPHTVSLSVRDYGCGIPEDRLSVFRERGTGMGVGLGGMRERARELGGSLRILPGLGGGTIIFVDIPSAANMTFDTQETPSPQH
jgi:PAS domain S-box-containing protein